MDGGSAATAGGDGSSAKATEEGSAPVTGYYRCGKEGHISTNYTEARCKA